MSTSQGNSSRLTFLSDTILWVFILAETINEVAPGLKAGSHVPWQWMVESPGHEYQYGYTDIRRRFSLPTLLFDYNAPEN